MPSKPKTICPKCKRAWDGERCECGHQRRKWGWQNDRERGTRQERGYTDAWLRLSERIRRERRWCERCEAKGRLVLATTVHHLRYQPDGGKIVPDEWLQALCEECHREAEAEKARGT